MKKLIALAFMGLLSFTTLATPTDLTIDFKHNGQKLPEDVLEFNYKVNESIVEQHKYSPFLIMSVKWRPYSLDGIKAKDMPDRLKRFHLSVGNKYVVGQPFIAKKFKPGRYEVYFDLVTTFDGPDAIYYDLIETSRTYKFRVGEPSDEKTED